MIFESELADPEIMFEDPPAAPSFEMTAGQVRAFLRAYEEQFGTLEVYEAGFYPNRVGVMVPVRGSRPRMERWSWTGEWRQDTEASRVTGARRHRRPRDRRRTPAVRQHRHGEEDPARGARQAHPRAA